MLALLRAQAFGGYAAAHSERALKFAHDNLPSSMNSADVGMATVIGGAVLGAAAAIAAGSFAMWAAKKIKAGWSRDKVNKVASTARKKMQSDPKFAKEVRSKVKGLKEDLEFRRRYGKIASALHGIQGSVAGGVMGAATGAAISSGGAGSDVARISAGALAGGTVGSIAGGLIGAGVGYVLGRIEAWISDAVTGGLSREKAEKIAAAAKHKLQTDPEFAAKVRAAAAKKKHVKEDLAFRRRVGNTAAASGAIGGFVFSQLGTDVGSRIASSIVSAAAWYLAGRAGAWVADRIKNGKGKEDAEDEMKAAIAKLKSDPKFAAKAKAKAASLKEEKLLKTKQVISGIVYALDEMNHVDQDKPRVPEIGMDYTTDRYKSMTPGQESASWTVQPYDENTYALEVRDGSADGVLDKICAQLGIDSKHVSPYRVKEFVDSFHHDPQDTPSANEDEDYDDLEWGMEGGSKPEPFDNKIPGQPNPGSVREDYVIRLEDTDPWNILRKVTSILGINESKLSMQRKKAFIESLEYHDAGGRFSASPFQV